MTDYSGFPWEDDPDAFERVRKYLEDQILASVKNPDQTFGGYGIGNPRVTYHHSSPDDPTVTFNYGTAWSPWRSSSAPPPPRIVRCEAALCSVPSKYIVRYTSAPEHSGVDPFPQQRRNAICLGHKLVLEDLYKRGMLRCRLLFTPLQGA